MPIYRYPSESLVDTLHILANDKGGLRAYLYAEQGVDTERLRLLKQALRTQAYKCVPTLYEGKPVLEVRGFEKPEELVGYLDSLHAIKGTPEIVAAEGDVRTKKQKLGNATLKAAGVSYNIGDTAYMWYTAGPIVKDLVKKKKGPDFFGVLEIMAGIGYGLGSVCLTLFGSKDQSINTIKSATSKIERFSRNEGYDIAPESSISYVNKEPDRGAWGNLKQTISHYPSESLNAIYVGVGVCMAAAALHKGTKTLKLEEFGEKTAELITKFKEEGRAYQHITQEAVFREAKRDQIWDKIDVGLGAITAASAITGLAVKEQKRMEGDPKRHGIGGVIDWIREKPLRATGIGYMIATGFHTISTVGKWNNRNINGADKNYLVGRVIFIISNVLSEVLLTVSSKGHGVGVKPDSSVDDSILSAAAELVLRQPIEKREAIISQLSGYIASPEVLAVKADKIEATLREHISKLERNPWTKHYVPNTNGEMVEAAPEAPVGESAVKLQPTTVVSHPEYVAKQQLAEHSLA